jgi:large subunit ribosomal protein L3
MSIGLIGQKCGMTRIFTEDGVAVPVSVIQVQSNRVMQVKNCASDGYSAVQIGAGEKKPSRVSKPMAGHYVKAGQTPAARLREFRVDAEDAFVVGQEIGVETFSEGQHVDVSGVSIGKGFAGVIKRYNFSTQDASHGNSLSHRAPGSIGQNQSPGRVFKGKKMAGHMGAVNCTTQNLLVYRVDKDRGLIMIKGAVPGHKGAFVVVKPAAKSKG